MPVGARNRVIAGCGLHHVAVQTRDWEASLRLYRDVLGRPVGAEFGSPARRVVLLDMGDGSHVELFQPTATSPEPGHPTPNDPLTHVALATTDTPGGDRARPGRRLPGDGRAAGRRPERPAGHDRLLQGA